jgi:predicted amidohydrolase
LGRVGKPDGSFRFSQRDSKFFLATIFMRIGFAQINTTVGDINANKDRILSAYEKAVALGADLVLTPELALTGYPPQDLVFKSRFVPETLESLDRLREAVGTVPLLIGMSISILASQANRSSMRARC